MEIEVVVASTAGFCSGVRQAIQGVEERLQENRKLYCLGDIIHNPDVIESLKDSGLVVTDRIEAIPDRSRFVVRTHGLQKEILQKAAAKELTVFDFTCPRVKKIHHLVTTLTEDEYHIFIIGNPNHPEVQAISSLIGTDHTVLQRPEDVPSYTIPEPNAVVVQTTFNPDIFLALLSSIVLRTKKTLVCNTLCGETLKRQQEARRLAGETDFIVVVGGKHSSNTKTLFAQIRNIVPAVHIENARELQKDWFRQVKKVGVISGASTPAQEVARVADRLSEF
jgi:4-hydroxy-3-methylbut-2-enyl diphosphate reductase